MPTLNFDLKKCPEVFDDNRWTVLTALILHANELNRCWPSTEAIQAINKLSTTLIVRAKKWLIEHKAIELVPYKMRYGAKEKALPKRQHVYQLTGIIEVDGRRCKYLYTNDSEVLESEILPRKILPGPSITVSSSETVSSSVPPTEGEVAPHAPIVQVEAAAVPVLEEAQQIPPLVPPAPPIDPLFAFEAAQQGLVPAEAQANKKTKGWIWSLVSDFVNGEKRLLKVATLSKEQRAVLAGELPGFLRWYKEQCEGCSYPADVTAHARWVMRWYDAGKPYARIIAPPKHDPKCPDCKGSGLIDLLFNPKTNELVPEREKRWEPGWDRTTTYCTCRLLEGV